MKHPLQLSLIVTVVVILIFIVTEILIVAYNGTPVAVPTIARDTQTAGTGKPLRYVVMGDSTAISQGSDYADGYAAASIQHLAKTVTVTSLNTGVSGATAETVRAQQLQAAADFKPDIALLAVGANDATRFTSAVAIRNAIQAIVDGLRASNPGVHIIVTGSPAMDSVSRFPIGAKQLMALRTSQVNAVFHALTDKNDLLFAPIAAKTRDAFLADPTLTAADKFHPNARGYALWIPVINEAIDRAIAH